VRRRIHTFVDDGGMKVGEFCDAIGVSQHSYSNFLGRSGTRKGEGSECYPAAYRSFKEREERGKKMPVKRRKTTSAEGGN